MVVRTHLFILLRILLSVPFLTNAQSYTIRNVNAFNPRHFDAITENQNVIGYYSLNTSAVPGTKNINYELCILDSNLNLLHKGTFQKSKNTRLLESAWNGTSFCFSFLDPKQNSLEYQLLDASGRLTGTYLKSLNKLELNYYTEMLPEEMEAKDNNLIAIDSNLFVRYGIEFGEGQSFQAEAFDNSGKRVWEYTSVTTYNSSFETFLPIYADKNILVLFLTEYESLESENVKFSTLILNSKTGAFKVKLPILFNGKKLIPLGCAPNTGKDSYFLYGNYFTSEKNIVTADPDGFFIHEMDVKGKFLKESFISRVEDIEPRLNSLSHVEFKKNTKIYAHKMIKTLDGRVFVIGEAYRKKLNEKAVTNYLLSGPYHGTTKSLSKIVLNDLFVFELDSLTHLTNISRIEKDETDVHYSQKIGLYDSNLLGSIIKRQGKFDYRFLNQFASGAVFECVFLNRENGKSDPNNYVLGKIKQTDSAPVVTSKLNVRNDASLIEVRRAKQGCALLLRYYRPTSKVVLELKNFEIQ